MKFEEGDYWFYNELGQPEPIRIDRKGILDVYWDYWSKGVAERFGEDYEYITEENCINDWVISNWAWRGGAELELRRDADTDFTQRDRDQ